MRPDGVNGSAPAQQSTLIERIDAVDIKNTNQLSETLAGLRDDAEKEINDAFADGKITKKESQSLSFLMSRFCGLNGQIKNAIRNAGDEIKNLYEQASQNLNATIKRLTDASNGRNPDAVALEPQDVDAQRKQKYAALNKQADKLLKASIEEDKARINSSKVHAFNPAQYDRKPRPSSAAIDQIKDLYMSTLSDNGKRVRTFHDPEKINQLIDWAKLQLKTETIDQDTYRDLTKDAVAVLNNLSTANNTAGGQGETTTDNKKEQFWADYQKVLQDALNEQRAKEQADINEIIYGS